MANADHVALLRQGVEVWNEQPPETPDLSGTDLKGANLIGADLKGANLVGANLEGADLSRANLIGANLAGADLAGTHLSGADLRSVDLRMADLGGAQLTSADLGGAFLRRTKLSRANLEDVQLQDTVFADVDLSEAKGLQEVRHRGPSTIGVDCLYRSEGRIPPDFLRGCGLSGDFIRNVPGLAMTGSIQHHSAFISYSHADAEFAQLLYDYLFHEKKVPTWLDEHEIDPGDLIMKEVDDGIRRTDRVIFLCSAKALESWWIRQEFNRWTRKETELEKETGKQESVMIPVDLDGAVWTSRQPYAATVCERLCASAEGWREDHSKATATFPSVERALQLKRLSPFDLMEQQGVVPHEPT